ncbi:MAG: OmpA family protein [Verrucomicrobiota bacterium]
MRFSVTIPALLAVALFGCAGCGSLQDPAAGEEEDAESSLMGGTPRRAEVPSFTGPGSSRVQRGKMPGIDFGDVIWEIPESEKEKIKAVAAYLKGSAERVILAGGAVVTNAEYARQLGQQRAIAVKNALIREGIPANTIITVSYGLDLPGRGGDRVEFGFIPTGEKREPGR